jgi:hypothetical protein
MRDRIIVLAIIVISGNPVLGQFPCGGGVLGGSGRVGDVGRLRVAAGVAVWVTRYTVEIGLGRFAVHGRMARLVRGDPHRDSSFRPEAPLRPQLRLSRRAWKTPCPDPSLDADVSPLMEGGAYWNFRGSHFFRLMARAAFRYKIAELADQAS